MVEIQTIVKSGEKSNYVHDKALSAVAVLRLEITGTLLLFSSTFKYRAYQEFKGFCREFSNETLLLFCELLVHDITCSAP